VLPFSEESWQRGLAAAVPAKILTVNQRAFALGRAFGSEEVSQ
jgi:Pyruvate/2-oxoacid:ferredoxin oxidoreductase gamma subunit